MKPLTKITTKIALEIIQHEAIVRQAYKDSVDVWTWGVGVTNSSGHNVTRYIGNPQPMQKVLEVYIWLLETKYLPAVEEAFFGADITEEQLAAALSFHWNTGAIKKATWVKQFMAGDVIAAKKSFMNYRKPASIIDRRKAERDLFFSGKWTSGGASVEITRVFANGNPDWRSRKSIDVSGVIGSIIATTAPAPVKTPWWGRFTNMLRRLK